MYNIVIFSGGTGSIELQKGIASLYKNNRVNLDIIINAYDNGKSTGECRKVFQNQILGPSDFRKNQMTQFVIKYAKELKKPESVYSQLLHLFQLRISADSYEKYYEKGKKILWEATFLDQERRTYLLLLLDYFFFVDKEKKDVRELVKTISFKDFSLSNIFYASCAAMNKNSLATAGKKMAEILGISDNIHLISHVPLLLKARTKMNYTIENEGEIVKWNKEEDPIKTVFFLNSEGREYIPYIDEGIAPDDKKTIEIIEHADLIIFSPGTQWSSLIPTYMHKGFRKAVDQAKAAKYLIMNNVEDHDMRGISSDEICNILDRYMDLSKMKIVINDNAVASMKKKSDKFQYIHACLSEEGSRKHDAEKTILCIFQDFFREGISKSVCMFDLDGTLWDDREIGFEVGRENLQLFKGIIVSGNSYRHVKDILESCEKNVRVFCDYGNTYFETVRPNKTKMLTKEYFIEEKLIERIKEEAIFRNKVQLRGNVVLTIKPLENRNEMLEQLQEILKMFRGKYCARIAGYTSIDICRTEYNKAVMIQEILNRCHLEKENLIFIGNEISAGNETEIRNMGIYTLEVKDIYECNVFLRTLESARKSGFSIER